MIHIGVLIPKKELDGIFSDQTQRKLEEVAIVRWNDSDEHLSEEEAIRFLRDCTIAVSSWGTVKPTKNILDACPSLRLWEHAAGSVKSFFTEELKGRELVIASCAPAIGKTVAEMALGELIIGLRRIIPNAESNRTEWRAPVPNKLYMSASTIGVVGASQVGRYLLDLLRPFHAKVLLYDPFISSEAAAELGAIKVDDLLQLCRESDAITMHTPVTDQTRHMMGSIQFQAMKDDAVFINTSRGACIDEQALIDELSKGRLFAFLDVSDPEPAEMNNPIRRLPNVIYTSHLAGGPSYHIGDQAASDIIAFMNEDQPRFVVTWDQLDRLA